MSHLHTRDPERAAAFYRALFGWTTESFGQVTMFRLPGYVGGEPEQPVSREVIATMGALEGASPPQWSIDFWVGDVEETAAMATRLGGRIAKGPMDNPVGTSALLVDPQGVWFSISNDPRKA